MRKTLTPLIAAFLTLTLFSCSSDDLMSEEASIETADLTVKLDRTSTPCEGNLLSMVSNSNLGLDCLSDLGGKTIDLPKGVNLEFKGGTLSNGTLHFNGGTIDGRLLKKGLKITGDVKLSNSTYMFEPSQWGITQGPTNDAKALTNRLNLNEAIELTKDLGGKTFEIGQLDAYFEVITPTGTIDPNFYEWREAIQVPSNMHLKLSDNTKLRVQPNNSYVYALVAFNLSTNAKLSGGKLYGDRNNHNFNGNPRFPSHEWGNIVLVHGAQNVKVENVSMFNANGDNLKIEGDGFVFESHHTPAKYVTITGCTMDSARRNGLTIAGGEDVIIDNNTFLRTGVDTNKSKGTNPRFSIDIEAFRKVENGEFRQYDEVDGVVIKNNTQKLGSRGGFLVSIGKNVTIENNEVENGIGYKHGENTIIRNNYIKARNPDLVTGIYAGDPYAKNTQKNNKIYGNTIEGFRVGMILRQQDHDVYDNLFKDCTIGIQAKSLKDTKIHHNTIKSNKARGKGIFFHLTSCDNVKIYENNITTKFNPINMILVNNDREDKNKKLEISNNTVNSDYVASLKNSKNIEFKDNNMYTALEVFDCEDIKFDNNVLDAHKTNRHTIDFRGKIIEMTVSNNDLTAPRWKQNTKTDDRAKMAEIREWGNSWNYK